MPHGLIALKILNLLNSLMSILHTLVFHLNNIHAIHSSFETPNLLLTFIFLNTTNSSSPLSEKLPKGQHSYLAIGFFWENKLMAVWLKTVLEGSLMACKPTRPKPEKQAAQRGSEARHTQATQLLCIHTSNSTSCVVFSLHRSHSSMHTNCSAQHFPTFNMVLRFLMQPLSRWQRDGN